MNILYLKNILTKNPELKKAIINYDRNEILRMIKENYLLFSIIDEKEWDNKKIRIARSLYDSLFKSIKNPEIRT